MAAVSPLKGGDCVSTVSIVGGLTENLHDRGARASQIGATLSSPAGGGVGRPTSGSIIADAADGADGIFEGCTHPDDPASGSAFTTKRNVDAQRAQKGLRTSQPPGKSAGIPWPGLAVPRSAIAPATIGGDTQRSEEHTSELQSPCNL